MSDDEIQRMPRFIARWPWLAHWVGFYCWGFPCVPECDRSHDA